MLRANEFRGRPGETFALRLSVFFIAIFFYCRMLHALPAALAEMARADRLPDFLDLRRSGLFARRVYPGYDICGGPVRTAGPASVLAFLGIAFLRFDIAVYGRFSSDFYRHRFVYFVLDVGHPDQRFNRIDGGRSGRGDYGRMRLWGSLSYIAMTSAGGVAVDFWGPAAALWLFIGAAICVLIAVHWLPGDEDASEQNTPPGTSRPHLRFADIGKLLRHPQLWLFLAATSAIQSAHAVYYIFGTLHWTAAEISPTIIGALWGIGVIAEIVLFAYGTSVSRFFSPVQLLAIAGAAGVFRWTITAFNPPLPILFLVQMLHGLTFGAAHLGAMQFMTRAIPHSLAVSAQGLYASITMGIGMGLASLAAGPLYRNFAGGAYFAMAALCLMGLLAAFWLIRRWQGGLIVEARAPLQSS